ARAAERHGVDPSRAAVGPRLRRIAAKPLRRHDRDDVNVEARGTRESRDDVTVARIIAGAAEHGDSPRVGPALAELGERRGAGAAHQLVARNAELVDRDAV